MPKTADQKSEQLAEAVIPSAATEKQDDLYDEHLRQFRSLLRENTDEALEVYGFAFYFSLPDSERMRVKKQLGFSEATAVDLYNFAAIAIEDGSWQEAIEHLQKALEIDPKFQDAAYNLALCYERLGQKADAHKAWEQYIALCTDPTEKERITAHVAELTSY
ncbi:MAG: tetratricopeptide repeat protein [Candidatus Sumerlaeaceae bacterium]